jgi:hypothetical protein
MRDAAISRSSRKFVSISSRIWLFSRRPVLNELVGGGLALPVHDFTKFLTQLSLEPCFSRAGEFQVKPRSLPPFQLSFANAAGSPVLPRQHSPPTSGFA